MSKILTVVVPSYNVEKYMEQNLQSFVIDEVMNDIEVLVVNDGSTDKTEALAKEYEKRYPGTFRVINKKNGGHGSTINCGIKEASGKYFKVVDADDWVLKEGFIHLVETLKHSDSHVVVSNFYWYHDKKKTRTVEIKEPFAQVEYKREYTFGQVGKDLYVKMHGMTIQTQILRKIPPLDEHCFYVDVEYALFPIPFVETFTFIEDFVYMYRIGLAQQSMIIKKMQKNAEDFNRVFQRMFAFYRECRENEISSEKLHYIEQYLGRIVASKYKIYLSLPYDKKIKQEMVALDLKIKSEYPNVYYGVRQKAVLLLRKSNYNLYYIAQKAYKTLERMKSL